MLYVCTVYSLLSFPYFFQIGFEVVLNSLRLVLPRPLIVMFSSYFEFLKFLYWYYAGTTGSKRQEDSNHDQLPRLVHPKYHSVKHQGDLLAPLGPNRQYAYFDYRKFPLFCCFVSIYPCTYLFRLIIWHWIVQSYLGFVQPCYFL